MLLFYLCLCFAWFFIILRLGLEKILFCEVEDGTEPLFVLYVVAGFWLIFYIFGDVGLTLLYNPVKLCFQIVDTVYNFLQQILRIILNNLRSLNIAKIKIKIPISNLQNFMKYFSIPLNKILLDQGHKPINNLLIDVFNKAQNIKAFHPLIRILPPLPLNPINPTLHEYKLPQIEPKIAIPFLIQLNNHILKITFLQHQFISSLLWIF